MYFKTKKERDFTEMKKNKMMRTASALLVLVLLTVSIICGTFAKYTTSGSASDSATVAKWGIKIKASGSLFDKNYFAANDETKGNEPTPVTGTGITVNSSGKVVAPGTQNSNGVTFTVEGKAETDVKLTLSATAATTGSAIDVFLNKGQYTDANNNTVTIEENYHPISYTLTDTNKNVKITGTLTYIEEQFNEYIYAGNDLSDTYKLTWEWAYDDGGKNDVADTLLGDLAAGKASGTDGSYSVSPDVKVSIIATQVD
jgi:hypothetical protein